MNISIKQFSLQLARGWLGSIILALLLATSFKSAIADWYVVPTGSMNPTIVEGDRIFTNKLAYDLKVPYTTLRIAVWDNPRRGDIVVFNPPEPGPNLVKRVVGVPGDIVAMRDNQLSINGEFLEYEPIEPQAIGSSSFGMVDSKLFVEDLTGHKHITKFSPYQPSIRSFGPVVVPAGQYLMMGDNRDNSADSRYFGFIDREKILGKATTVVISLDLQQHYKPRWSRFFSQLM